MKQCLPISALFLVLLCCLGFSPTYAQTTVTIGSGTLSNYFYGPIYRSSSTSSFDYSRYHYLFTASELAAAGVPAGATITKIEWNKTSAFNITGAGNAYFNVFMNNTSSTALTSGTQWGVLTAGSTHVFAGVYNTTNNLPAAAGWVGFTLALPFAYAGGSLEISTDWDVSAVTGTTTGGAFNWEYTSGAAFTQTLGAANSTALTSTTTLSTSSYGGSLRPNIRITFLPPSSNYCAIPAPTSVTNLTGTSATLNWTPVTGAVNYQWAVKQAGTTVASGTSTGSSVNVTGLSPVTSYIFEISTTCSSSNSVTTAQGFTTLCASYTPPYTEGFATFVPSCWSLSKGALAAPTTFTSTISSLWIADGFANVGTTGAAKMNVYSTARYEWLISPSIDLSGGNYQLEFDLALTAFASTNPAGTTGTDDKFAVVISTDNGATWSSANTLRQWDNAGSPYVYNSIATTGEHVVINLTGYTGTVKVGFYAESTVSNADNDLFVDNVEFLPVSSCPKPLTLSASAITATSADLSWIKGGTETQWQLEWGASGFTQGTGTMVSVSTNPSYSLSGLTPLTAYQYYVRSVCGGVTSPTWTGPYTFTTACATYMPPYTEGFATFVPSCWSLSKGALAASTTFTSTTSSLWIADGFANVGTTGAARMNVYSTAKYEWLISPSIDLSGGLYQLEFDLALTAYASTNPAGTTGTDDKFAVVISTDNGATWSSANTIRQWDNAGSPYVYNSIATTGEHVILDLTPYTGTIKVGFYAESTVSNADNDLFVDNVEFLPVPSCSKPQSLAAVSDTTSAVISWMGGAIGPNNAFEVEWDSAGFTQGSGNVVSVNGTSTTLTGLASLGYYTFYVRQYCGGSDYSTWAGPFTFRTQSNIPGSTCALALPAVVGVNAADGPSDGFGAITPSATHADWFYFTPTQNALMSVNSCGGGVDTRLYIFSGNCGSLTQVGTNDDACDMGNGSLWASSLSNIAVTAGTTYYIYWDNFNANSGLPFNWTLSLITCGVPSNLNVTNIASSSATLGWTNSPAGNNNSFQIQYGPMGFALGTGTDVYSTTNSYNLAGLSPQTFYGYYVRQICSVGDTSGWVGPRTFRTQPICGNLNTANLPFFEGFEYTGYTTQTSGDALFCSSQRRWDFESDHAAGRVQFGTNAPLNCGGTGAVLLDVSPITTSPVPTQYLTLTLNMAAHAAKSIAISFDFRDHGDEVHANDRVWARGDTSQPWVQVYDWSTTNLTTCTSVLDLNITTPLAAAGQTLGTTFQLRFGEQDDNPYSSDGLTIDNVSIYEYYCAKPTALNATNITQTGATLGWTMGTTGASKWDVQYGTTGFAVGSGTTVVASGTPQAVVSGLMNNTSYEFYVREYCSTGGKSNWTGPFAFRTLCGVIAAPYSENFESIAVAAFGKLTPTCWETTPTTGFRWESEDATGVNENSLNTGPFYDHTYEGAAGGKYMYTEASSGSTGNTADLVSPWISFAGMVNPTVDFYYHMYGQHISRLDVQATTDGVNYTTVYSLVGPQHTSGGAAWKLAQVKLTGFDGQTVQVRFRVTRGSSFEGDVSIDDVSFNGNCPDNTFALAKNSALGCNNATTTVTGATPAGYTTYWFTDGVQDTVAIDNGNGATVYINDSTFFYVQGVNQTTGCVGYDTILVTPYTDNNVLWENVSSTATVQPGNILYKTGTVIGFNAGASSVQRLAAGTDGWAEMVLTNNKTKAFGLSSVDAGYDDKTINFGFRSKTSNTYDVLENGRVRTNGSYQLGDVFRVQRMNGQIFYLVNGAVKYVSTVTSTSELLVDVSLSSGKTQIDSVDISFPCGDPMTPCTDLAFNIGMPNDTVCTDSSLVYTMPMYYNTSWFEMGNPTPVFTTSNGGSITLSPMMSKTYVVKGVHMLTGCIGYDTLDVFVDTTCCDLHWTNVSVGVVVNPNNTLTKTSTSASSQLGAISEEFLPAGNSGSIEITMASNTIYRAFGFSPSFTGATFNNIAFGIRMNASGQARIIEYGVTKGPALTYVSGDVFSVRRSGSVVAYLMNGAVVYTSTVASTTDLYVNGTVVTSGATLEPITNNFVCPCYDFNYAIAAPAMDTICYNETYAASGTSGYTAYWYDAATATLVATDAGTGVVLAPTEATTYHVVAINNTTGCIAYDTLTIEVNQGLTWTNFSNSTFVDANQTLKRVNQTGSTIGFTEGASSVQGLGMNEDGWVELTVQAVRSKAFGFSEVDTAYDFKSILYGFQMIATGGLNVFEAGKRKYQGTYAVGTVLRVSRVGGVVSFSVNGTTVYTSTLTSTAPLIVDASIASNNANLERLSTSFICPPAGSANRVVNNSNQTTANPNRQGVAFEGNITVSPNPTTGILNIQAEQPIQRILVVDVFGRVLKQIHGTNANQITVSIEDLATGVYLIQVDGKTIKVVKD